MLAAQSYCVVLSSSCQRSPQSHYAPGCWPVLQSAGLCFRVLACASGCWPVLQCAGLCFRVLASDMKIDACVCCTVIN